MSRYFGRRSAFSRFVVLAMLLAFSCCSIKKFPDVSRNVTEFKSSRSHNGVALVLDPFVEENRLEEHFGVDLLNRYAGEEHTYAILPVYVAMENSGDTAVLLQTGDVHLLAADGTVIGSAANASAARLPANWAYAKRGQALGTFASLCGLLPPVCVGVLFAFPFMASADGSDKSAEAAIVSKAMPEKSLGRGDANRGFVYFLFKDGEIASVRNASMVRAKVGNLDTGEKTTFEFEIGRGALSNRLASHDWKPAGTADER